jgi:Na+/melibiose symporter-like transporter
MGFDKNLPPAADQSPGARQAMLIGFVWIPVVTQLLAMVLLRWYRLEQRDLVGTEIMERAHGLVDSKGEGIPPGRAG